jgi:hypothetical protein
MNRYAFIALLALALLLPACGGGGSDSPPAACTNTANMELFTSAATTTLMTSITVSAAQNTAVPSVPVWVWYDTAQVSGIILGYPKGGVHPLTYGINIVPVGDFPDDPVELSVTFDAYRAPGTYNAVLRFVAVNMDFSGPSDCQDLPVTFTVN